MFSELNEMDEDNNDMYLKICNSFNLVTDFFREMRADCTQANVVLQPFGCNSDSDGNNTVLQAHKEILAAASPFLAEILANSCDCKIHLSFSEYSYGQLKLLLDYIYTGEIQACKSMMDEFEMCLKELGILGTHSYIPVRETVKDSFNLELGLDPSASLQAVAECGEESAEIDVSEIASLMDTSLVCATEAQEDEEETDDSQHLTTIQFVQDSNFIKITETEPMSMPTVTAASSKSSEDKELRCEICGTGFYSRDDLRAHLQTHNSKRPYVCPICQKSFRHLNVLKTHARVHTGEKPFSCSVCNRAFAHKSTLNEHMNLHSDECPYECTACQKRFKQRKSLRAHRCEDAQQEEVFQCEVCGRHFINRKALALHRIHHDAADAKNKEPHEKPFLCDVCARGFRNKYLLKAHQMTHSDEKRFECPVCQKRFSHKKTLQVHESSHGSEKGPYHCAYCTKSFRYVANLDAHERVHTGDKPFACQLCGSTFRQKSSLKEHMMTHTSEKPFHCEVCGKSFQARRQFVAHRYSHSKQTQRCPICKKRFYNADRLATHISKHDNIDDLPEPDLNAADGQVVDPAEVAAAEAEEECQLLITQVVDQNSDQLILSPSSLLHVIHAGDDDDGRDNHSAHQDAHQEDGQWAIEVVIEPRS